MNTNGSRSSWDTEPDDGPGGLIVGRRRLGPGSVDELERDVVDCPDTHRPTLCVGLHEVDGPEPDRPVERIGYVTHAPVQSNPHAVFRGAVVCPNTVQLSRAYLLVSRRDHRPA